MCYRLYSTSQQENSFREAPLLFLGYINAGKDLMRSRHPSFESHSLVYALLLALCSVVLPFSLTLCGIANPSSVVLGLKRPRFG